MNLCKDCHWSSAPHIVQLMKHTPPNREWSQPDWLCMRPVVSPMTGEDQRLERKCDEEREDIKGRCGPSGAFFQSLAEGEPAKASRYECYEK